MSAKPTAAKKKKAAAIYAKLAEMHPDARIELKFKTPLELVVATVLSAQCTDVRVNEVTKDLFKKYKTVADYAGAAPGELEDDIRSTGFFNQKAKSIRGLAAAIIEKHGGEVPADMDALTKLPGVGRKTANVILGNAFDTPGIAVDTHVKRLSGRLGLTSETDPVKIEFALADLFPRKNWTQLSHLLIFHGRYLCKARKPQCERCLLPDLCDYYRKELAR